LKKNITYRSGEVQAIARKRQIRKDEEGRETDFELRGVPVDFSKVERTMKRRKMEIPTEVLLESCFPCEYQKRPDQTDPY
jgi:hypothetical protein